MQTDEARRALETIAETRAGLASVGECPPWRHAAFGAIMGGLVLGQGLGGVWHVPLFVAAMAGVALVARSDRRRYGVFVNGFRVGRTLPINIGLMLVVFGLMFAELQLREQAAPLWQRIAIGLVAVATGVIGSVWWNRVFRAEMLGRQA